jgi:hypothetical protein
MRNKKLMEFAAEVFESLFYPEDFSNDTYAETRKWLLNNYTPWLNLPEKIKVEIMEIIDRKLE